MPLVEHVLGTPPEHMSVPSVFRGICFAQYLVFCLPLFACLFPFF